MAAQSGLSAVLVYVLFAPEWKANPDQQNGNVAFFPVRSSEEEAALAEALDQNPPAVLVIRDLETYEWLTKWMTLHPRPSTNLFLAAHLETINNFKLPDCNYHFVSCPAEVSPIQYDLLLISAATAFLQSSIARPVIETIGPPAPAKQEVILIGAGIVNLITALSLCDEYHVRIFDEGFDPRNTLPIHNLGATHSGGNARMCTVTEADCYAPRFATNEVNQNDRFSKALGNNGWLSEHSRPQSQDDLTIARIAAIPEWKGELYARDIYGVNLYSMQLWRTLRDKFPHLFADVNYTDGILRVYEKEEDLRSGVQRQRELGTLVSLLTNDALGQFHPATRSGIQSGAIAGGMEVAGFTLQIRDFATNIIVFLEQQGVLFQWQSQAHSMGKDSQGRVSHMVIRSASGSVDNVSADHYIISTGSAAKWLRRDLTAAEAISGIYGIWFDLPNVYGQKYSIKYRGSDIGCEDANINVVSDANGQSSLLIGAGYCYIGDSCVDRTSRDFREMANKMNNLAKTLFPEAFSQRAPMDLDSLLCCIRPWTPSGLGLFSEYPTSQGGVAILTGGNNTGGFTQAPAVAEAVRATLGGKTHELRWKFSTQRALGSLV